MTSSSNEQLISKGLVLDQNDGIKLGIYKPNNNHFLIINNYNNCC